MQNHILIFSISYYPFVGGAEVAIKEITDRSEDYRWSMITCLFDKKLPREEVVGNVRVYRINCPKILFPFLAFWKAKELQKKDKFNLVWAMMTYAGFAGLFFKIFNKKIPFLLSLQEGTPLSQIKKKSFFVYPLFKYMFKKADKIQAISNFLASFASQMGHKKEVVVIPNGVDVSHFSGRVPLKDQGVLIEQLGKKPDDIFLVTTSRLTYKNAVDDIIKSLKFLDENVQLIIIGKGEEGPNLQKLANELGVSNRVKFLGFVSHSEMPAYLSVCDIFVRPSRSEGFGNSFIEAMAIKLPVVATPVGGIVDFLDDKETGIFCCPDNPQSVADAVNFLVENKDETLKIIMKAFDRVSSRYDWNQIAPRMKTEVFDNIFYGKEI